MTRTGMNRTGVVVVTYNSGEVIERCLDSCAHLLTVVVDNASQDDTVELVRRRSSVKLISNPSNHGFAGAVNQGVAALDTEMILLLNPDVELETPVDRLADACGLENVGLATGKLVDFRGNVQTGFTVRRFPTPLTLVFEVLGINRVLPWNPAEPPLSVSRPGSSQVRRSGTTAGSFPDVPARSVAAAGRF